MFGQVQVLKGRRRVLRGKDLSPVNPRKPLNLHLPRRGGGSRRILRKTQEKLAPLLSERSFIRWIIAQRPFAGIDEQRESLARD
jgi:hypothetical protein